MKPLTLILAAGLLGLAGCTEYGYVKPGVTDEEYVADSQACDEIARHQAFRDFSVFESRSRFENPFLARDRFFALDNRSLSTSELEFRYRRLCMASRGYELAPLEEEGGGQDEGAAAQGG